MMTYSKLSKKVNTFRSFTGLDVPEFDKLFSFVKREYPKYEAERLSKRERTNALGQGRPFNLELIDRLLMLQAYYKLYTSLMLVGFLFNLDQSSVSRDIKHLEPLVQRCIPLPKKVYKKTKKIGTLEELLKYYPELKAFIDATEQQIPRPKNRRKRKSHYSGKKKKHTVKIQLMVNKKGLILHKTKHDKGKRHDYHIFKEKHPKTPKDVEKILDLGLSGNQKRLSRYECKNTKKEAERKDKDKERDEIQLKAKQGTSCCRTCDRKDKKIRHHGQHIQKPFEQIR